jgi:hypothetical protein
MTVTIRQQKSFLNRTIIGVSGDQDELVNYNASDFTSPTVYFEIVAENANASSQSVYLHDSGDTVKATITIPANTNVSTRFRASATPANDDHHINIGSTDINVHSAKLIIIQSAANILATQTEINLGDYDEFDAANTNVNPTNGPPIWKYESAKFDGTTVFTFCVVSAEIEMGAVSYHLQEATDAAFTTDVTELATISSVENAAATWHESASFTPTNNKYYRVCYQQTASMKGGKLYNAAVMITQTDATAITKLQTEYSLEETGNSGDRIMDNRPCYFDPAEWVGVTNAYYSEHIGNAGTTKTALIAGKRHQYQSYEESDSAFYGDDGSSDLRARGESFNSRAGFDIEDVVVSLRKVGSPTDNVTIKLASTGIDGTALATATIDGATLTTSNALVKFTFSSPYTLTANTTYYLRIERSGSRDETNYYVLRRSDADRYPDGAHYYWQAGGWQSIANDLVFALYDDDDDYSEVTNGEITGDDLQRSSALTMPASATEIASYLKAA